MKRAFLLLGLGASALASAGILSEDNFDSLSLGTLAGQNGWFSGSPGAEVVGPTGGISPASGGQMVRLATQASSDSVNVAWTDIANAWATRPAGNDVLRATVKTHVIPDNQKDVEFGLYVYSGPDLLAALTVNAFWNDARLYSADEAYASPSNLTLDKWYTLTLELDYTKGSITGWYDGTKIPDVFTFDPTKPVTDVDLTAVGVFNDVERPAFFDDYRVEAVPEPATVVALGLGALAALRRRSRG